MSKSSGNSRKNNRKNNLTMHQLQAAAQSCNVFNAINFQEVLGLSKKIIIKDTYPQLSTYEARISHLLGFLCTVLISLAFIFFFISNYLFTIIESLN
jgi:hypothetical protein